MAAPRNNLPFQYQMRGQQMQYLDGDLLAHAIDQRDRDLEDYLGRLAFAAALPPANTPTAWTGVTFQNGWQNFGGGWPSAQYRKVGDQVYLRGLISHPAAITPIVDSIA